MRKEGKKRKEDVRFLVRSVYVFMKIKYQKSYQHLKSNIKEFFKKAEIFSVFIKYQKGQGDINGHIFLFERIKKENYKMRYKKSK